MFGRVLNTLLISIQCKYNIKFSKKDQNTAKENRKVMNWMKDLPDYG